MHASDAENETVIIFAGSISCPLIDEKERDSYSYGQNIKEEN